MKTFGHVLKEGPAACQGPWKIYGDPCKSLELAEAHRKCRCRMSIQLASGVDPYERLRVRPVKEIASCSDRTFSLLNN